MPEQFIYDPLETNTQAQHEYEVGIKAVKEPPYTIAEWHYRQGLAFLGVHRNDIQHLENGELAPQDVPGLPETALAAGLIRDLAVARMRQGLLTNDEAAYVDRKSHAANLIAAAEYIPRVALDRIRGGEAVAENVEPAMVSVHGVARATAMRMAWAETAHRISGKPVFDDGFLGELFPGDLELSDRNRLAQQVSSELFGGDNGYWLIGHIAVSMRALRAAGAANDDSSMEAWRKTRGDAFRWLRSNDPHQLPQSIATIARHRWSRRSVSAAKKDASSPQRF